MACHYLAKVLIYTYAIHVEQNKTLMTLKKCTFTLNLKSQLSISITTSHPPSNPALNLKKSQLKVSKQVEFVLLTENLKRILFMYDPGLTP